MDENLKKLLASLRNDPEARRALADKTFDELLDYAKAHGVNVSREELSAAIEDEREQLSADDLESVSGGNSIGGCARTCEMDGLFEHFCMNDVEPGCPACGGTDISSSRLGDRVYHTCNSCGNLWGK